MQTAIRLADYQPPDFHIATVSLDFALDPEATRVTARLEITRNGNHKKPLVLAGEKLKLVALALDGKKPVHIVDSEGLTIENVPDAFTLESVCEISPVSNTALEGLYRAGGLFCTQCEPEGFRRITFFLDRPDNLSVFTVRLEADKAQYPVLLSNGNRMESATSRPEAVVKRSWMAPKSPATSANR